MNIQKLGAVAGAVVLAMGLGAGSAMAQTAGQDMKDAGHDTAHATKRVAHKTARGTKHVAHATAHGTKVAAHDTAHGTKVAAHDTAHGAKVVGHKTENVGDKIVGKPATH